MHDTLCRDYSMYYSKSLTVSERIVTGRKQVSEPSIKKILVAYLHVPIVYFGDARKLSSQVSDFLTLCGSLSPV